MVRPEEVRLSLVEHAADAGGSAVVRGVVADVQFKGGSSHVAVDVPGRERPFLVSVPGTTSAERGAQVALTWSAAVVVPDELA